MEKLNLLDKFKILFGISKSSIWFLLALVLLMGLGIFLSIIQKRKIQKHQKIYIISILSILMILLIIFSSSINHFFDYFMNNFFLVILFPNFAVYFAGIIITNIIFWISFFSKKSSRIIQNLNLIIYLFLTYLFILLLNVVDATKLDLFNPTSLYKSAKAASLMDISSGIFILWIIFLCIYKIILLYLSNDNQKETVFIKETVHEVPKNYISVTPPEYLFGNPGKRVTIFNPNPSKLIEDYEKKLTLEDYQVLLMLLKDTKKRTQQRNIEIKEELTKEKIVEMKQEEDLREKEKYTELERLYRGIL